jgi:3D (Asp-Asp-Asp) domain-containing protein
MKTLIIILTTCLAFALARSKHYMFYDHSLISKNYHGRTSNNKVNSKYLARRGRTFNMTGSFYSREEIHGAKTAGGIRGGTLYEAMIYKGLLQASVDVHRIPLYTQIEVLLWNVSVIKAMVVDTGPNYSENLIDIFVNTIAEAIELGRQPVQISILK